MNFNSVPTDLLYHIKKYHTKDHTNNNKITFIKNSSIVRYEEIDDIAYFRIINNSMTMHYYFINKKLVYKGNNEINFNKLEENKYNTDDVIKELDNIIE